jgi:anthranilate phosphoribosyltransferase
MGVYDGALCVPLAQVLHRLGSKAAAVVHGADGLDEVSVTGATIVAQLINQEIARYEVTPQMAGLPIHALQSLRGGDAAYNAASLRRLLMGEAGAYRDAVLMNTAAALIIADKVDDLPSGVALAAEAIDAGRAMQVLSLLVEHG